MKTVNENPNDRQIREAKTTRSGSIEKSKDKGIQGNSAKEGKKVKGGSDEGAADDKPFDARSNNMHQKR